jgi:hypothetical protein
MCYSTTTVDCTEANIYPTHSLRGARTRRFITAIKTACLPATRYCCNRAGKIILFKLNAWEPFVSVKIAKCLNRCATSVSHFTYTSLHIVNSRHLVPVINTPALYSGSTGFKYQPETSCPDCVYS